MPTAKRVIKSVRRIPKPQDAEPLWKKMQAEAQAKEYRLEFWERDKKVVRDQNFKKMQLALSEYRKRAQDERERQERIAEQRIENLKKARRKLAKEREEQ